MKYRICVTTQFLPTFTTLPFGTHTQHSQLGGNFCHEPEDMVNSPSSPDDAPVCNLSESTQTILKKVFEDLVSQSFNRCMFNCWSFVYQLHMQSNLSLQFLPSPPSLLPTHPLSLTPSHPSTRILRRWWTTTCTWLATVTPAQGVTFTTL